MKSVSTLFIIITAVELAGSVLTARDIETDEDFARISAMPGIASVSQLSRVGRIRSESGRYRR
jgi:hypothetical protein